MGNRRSSMMSYENSFQMYFVNLGLEEGERRGRLKAMRDIAYTMSEQGYSVGAIMRCLNVNRNQLRYLLNCTDWDFESVTTTACRIKEPIYK
ncbi:MAG: hypothetical protein IJ863_08530 [Spirochaetales bacterium]|nr:hypothetical protein [Spirochaetales bacterium]